MKLYLFKYWGRNDIKTFKTVILVILILIFLAAIFFSVFKDIHIHVAIYSIVIILFVLSSIYLFKEYIVAKDLYKKPINFKIIELIEESPFIDKVRCGGKISWMGFGRYSIQVMVFRRGLIIKPAFFPEIPLLYSEISSLLVEKGLYSNQITIEHNYKILKHPILLNFLKKESLEVIKNKYMAEK